MKKSLKKCEKDVCPTCRQKDTLSNTDLWTKGRRWIAGKHCWYCDNDFTVKELDKVWRQNK